MFIVIPPRYRMEEKTEITFDDQGNEIRNKVMEPISLPDPVVDVSRHYIKDGDIYERETLDLPDELRLTIGETQDLVLPDPCEIWIDREPHTVDGGGLTIEGEMEATYNIRINQWPFVPHNMKVTVYAPETH